MKRIVETSDADGLEKLLGENVQVWCMNYIYAGELVGVNLNDICLKNPKVVYETGDFGSSKFKDAQSMMVCEGFVRLSSIEFYSVIK